MVQFKYLRIVLIPKRIKKNQKALEKARKEIHKGFKHFAAAQFIMLFVPYKQSKRRIKQGEHQYIQHQQKLHH